MAEEIVSQLGSIGVIEDERTAQLQRLVMYREVYFNLFVLSAGLYVTDFELSEMVELYSDYINISKIPSRKTMIS